MKLESADYLAKTRECLDAPKTINAIPLPPVAAKEAYIAAYHAAHAFVFENTGRAVKSHSGMRTMFAQVAKADPRVDRKLASLLGRAYKYKETADYGIGSHAVVTAKEAQDVIACTTFRRYHHPTTAAGCHPATWPERKAVGTHNSRLLRRNDGRCRVESTRRPVLPCRVNLLAEAI